MSNELNWMLIFRMAKETTLLAEFALETDCQGRFAAIFAYGKHSN